MRKFNNNNLSVKTLTICGMMIAITLVMSYTPIGMIPMGTVSATISHIPTIIVSIIIGPIEGMIVGLAFGLISLFRALTSPQGVLDPLFINPLVSVLPRVLIAITTYYTYKGMYYLSKKDSISITIAGAIGSMTNTIGVLGIMYIIYAKDLILKLQVENLEAVRVVIIATVAGSGIIEMLVAAVITVIVAKALKRALHL